MTVQIDDRRLNDNLPNGMKRVLRTMFSNYEKAMILSEFSDGLSGSRVLLVRPIQSTGPELRSVVKVDSVEAIQQEWKAYQTCIQHKLPRTAVIHGEPVYPPGSRLGGLWYSLAGDGVFDVINLTEYVKQSSVLEIEQVLQRLLKSLDGLWGPQKYVEPELHLQTAYDYFLPANLFIEVKAPSQGAEVHWLHPNTIKKHTWKVGDYVQFSGFYPVEIDREKKRILFNMKGTSSFRLYLESISAVEEYEIGQEVYAPIDGKITQTRMGFLKEKMSEVVSAGEITTQTHFTLANGPQLPNPFMEVETILAQSFDAYKTCVHGDLHLKNILVGRNNGEIYLIDFGKSGRDYIMRDLLHLEMSIMTGVLAEKLTGNEALPEEVYGFYKSLHCAIAQSKAGEVSKNMVLPFAMLVRLRETARHYLFKANQWKPYYYALCLHLLGALKFSNLSDVAKQVAFWGSAAILKIVQDPPDCTALPDASSETTENQPVAPGKGESGSKYDITIRGGQGIVIGEHNQVTQTFNNRKQNRRD